MFTVVWGGGRLGDATAKYLCELGEEFYLKTRKGGLPKSADVVIDFSAPEATDEVLNFCLRHSIPLVNGVTGHSNIQKQKIALATNEIPIVYDSNFSYGINAVKNILTYTKKILAEWECGIVEYHRKGKTDAPSGTALVLSDIVKTENVTSVRIGEEAGTHETIFWGRGEKIVVTHIAQNIEPFIAGAVYASKKIVSLPPSLYSMQDLLNLTNK
ncbi:MAG TPA: dihydrodipicolinate reductase C-terminal domain-containing protein [Clostridia bacterium]|nr:dihydrodipicolinate reductase C-terminal domain-containing protein [Clostridia bacterium]